ncbi:hypothetical protein HKCCE3408_07400 [Rhodobacterales bacterium HKCCE3408]|nr:hypothetical protein [Rhodobacterales bacterium HKCCE3408]
MRSTICTSLVLALLASGARAATGCYAAEDGALTMYFYQSAELHGRYVVVAALSDGTWTETLAACPTDRACTAPCGGGGFEIVAYAEAGIEIAFDSLRLGCDSADIGAPGAVTRLQLSAAAPDICRGP